jgi:hypothetical protein
MTEAAKKAEQRKRRKAGFEVFSVTVFKPKLIAWLVREELLQDVDRWDRGKITTALEAYLSARYDLPDVPGEPLPRFAAGSFGREYTTLRDRPHHDVGLLEREGTTWNRREPPTRYLITARTAAIRRAADNIPDDYDPNPYRDLTDAIWPESESHLPLDAEPHYVVNDYDPEEDTEEASADLSDDAPADAFDAEGYEK